MQKCEGRITVFFDDPFWVAAYERVAGGKLKVCKAAGRASTDFARPHQVFRICLY
jgi:hypothetical protein